MNMSSFLIALINGTVLTWEPSQVWVHDTLCVAIVKPERVYEPPK